MPVDDSADTRSHARLRRRCRGLDEIRSAIDAGEAVQLVIVDEAARGPEFESLLEFVAARSIGVRKVTAHSLRRVAGPGEPAVAVAMVGEAPDANLEEMLMRAGAVWLLVGTEYPGNAGLAARTAEVSGAAGICIDAPFDQAGRKACLRASMRSDRFMPVLFTAAADVVEAARQAGRQVIVVEDVGDVSPWEVDLTRPSLFIVGGEAAGVPTPLIETADECIRIPTPGFVSSYNVQAAMAILAGEHLRQSNR